MQYYLHSAESHLLFDSLSADKCMFYSSSTCYKVQNPQSIVSTAMLQHNVHDEINVHVYFVKNGK